MEDPLGLIIQGVLLFAAGMYPLGLMLGSSCSPCCDSGCPWVLSFDRCLRYSFVGSSPPDGGDCRLEMAYQASAQPQMFRNLRSFPAGGVAIVAVQSKIVITVRVVVTAGSVSLGQTKSSVFRFIRLAIPGNDTNAYDLVGPPWHLQVDLQVTGVANENAGVQSSIEEDEHGQPKLVVVVSLGSSSVSYDEAVELLPTGLQRYANYRLTSSTVNATRVSGDVFSSGVSKLSGLTIVELAEAVHVTGLCVDSVSPQPQGTFLDDSSVAAFLAGDGELIVGSGSGPIALSVLPDNLLCGMGPNLGLGVPLGIYPEEVYAEAPAELGEALCGNTIFALTAEGCPSSNWFSLGRPRLPLSSLFNPPSVGVSSFYSGRTMLWHLETGPYRTSFVGNGPGVSGSFLPSTVPGWTYRLDGAESNVDPFIMLLPYIFPPICPPGFGSYLSTLVCVQSTVVLDIDGQTVTLFPVDSHPLGLSGHVLYMGFYTQATVEYRVYVNFPLNNCFIPGVVSGTVFQIVAISPVDPAQQIATATVEFKNSIRLSCGPWEPSELPVDGGTISRTCVNTDNEDTFPPSSQQTSSVPANGSRLPFLVRTGVLQDAQPCRLKFLRDRSALAIGFVPPPTSTAVFLAALSAGECRQYLPYFGPEALGTLCAGDTSSRENSIPCGGCTPSVTITSGEENASVEYITEGDKAGMIEVVAKRTWLGGQGVTFTVVCGDDEITQTIRRADTVPTAPLNLTATRGPCSQVTLQWETPEGDGGQPITAYNIQFRRIGVSTYTTFGTVAPPALSGTVTGLLRLGFEFRVSATNSLGTSAFSNVAVNGFTLAAPTNLSFVRGPCTAAQLSWTPPPQSECVVVASYILRFRVFGDGAFTTFGSVAGDVSTGAITGLTVGVRYQFSVGRVDDAGTQLFTGIVTSGNPPQNPFNVTPQLGSNPGEVNIAWSAVEEPCYENTNYLVQFRSATSSIWSDFSRPASANKFATVTGLAAGDAFFFRVRATSSVGNSGFSSQSVAITIPNPE